MKIPKQVICFESSDGALHKTAKQAREHDMYREAEKLIEPTVEEYPAYEAVILLHDKLQELFENYKDVLRNETEGDDEE